MSQVTRSLTHVVPKEIESKVQMVSFLMLSDLVVVAGVFFSAQVFHPLIHPGFQFIFSICMGCAALICIMRCFKNNGESPLAFTYVVFAVKFVLEKQAALVYYSPENPYQTEEENTHETNAQTV